MISVRTALDLVLAEMHPLGTERVALPQALGRILAEPVQATRDVPPFRNAAMDGYAVLAADVVSARRDAPVSLRVFETVGAGRLPRQRITHGHATKIMTGSPMPDGADAVVRDRKSVV
jgi:molybdopterin molybdotransferase